MLKAIAVAAIGAVLAGCSGQPSVVAGDEELLSGAGFRVMASNTGGYAAAVKQLPPHKVVSLTVDGVLTYYYLDPTVCGCLYYGGQENWDAYKQEMAEQRHIEAEQLLIRANTPYTGHGGW